MKNVHSISVLLFSLFISTSCHFQKGESNENNSSTNQLSLSMNNKMLQADTVKLSISNGSLSPDFQYYQEYVLTANEAIFKNQKGENPEVTTRKKMDKDFWENIRTFLPDKNNSDNTPHPDGAEEVFLDFIIKKKTYSFPEKSMEDKIEKIRNYF